MHLFKAIFIFFSLVMLQEQSAMAQVSPFQNYKQFARPKAIENFEFLKENGQPAQLSDYKGKVVLLNFWATWCGPCLKELPDLDKLAQKMAPLGLEVIPLNVDPRDSESKILRFYEKLAIESLGIFNDKDAQITLKENIKKFPHTMVINRDQKLIGIVDGFTNWYSEDAQYVLKSELQYNLNEYIEQTYHPRNLRPNFKDSPTQQQSAPFGAPLWKNRDAYK